MVASSTGTAIVFEGFLNSLLPTNCSLTADILSSSVADIVTGSTCQDATGGIWTFTTGQVLLNSSCSMSVLASGTYADPGQAGLFAVSISLSL